jgi:hypothetical protein
MTQQKGVVKVVFDARFVVLLREKKVYFITQLFI